MAQGTSQQARGCWQHLEDHIVLEDEVGDAGHEDEEGREDSSPQEDDAIGFWQLYQVGELEACEVVYQIQSEQGLQAAAAFVAGREAEAAGTAALRVAIAAAACCMILTEQK